MNGVAIIGMSGRFPGAKNTSEFWENLKNGIESIRRFRVEELEIPDRERQAKRPDYVMARPVLDGVEDFDSAFFGIYPQEAILMDPQHRIFLECCWEAIESAGYNPLDNPATTGVFAGCSANSYFLRQICENRRFIEDYTSAYQVGHYSTLLGSIGDTLSTRVSYKLNLKGPSMTLLTACSTSLVAVCQAVKSLMTYECDMALAGGISLTFPQERGYEYQAGGMVSPDGHCRTFDADAQGTVFGAGAGVVVLKRVDEAIADGDYIYAVIRGCAINNDGGLKAGFTAPSIEGQAQAIAAAQAMADIDPSTISYIEAHGTATPLGDPIEVAALTQVFRASTAKKGFCALGTAKTNVGHLDVAAGVAGLIKTALSMKHRQLPGVLHYKRPNPKLDLENSPFFVNSSLREWTSTDGGPLRAGVSSFGVGGTNAHVVLEEAPEFVSKPSPRPYQLIGWSAKSEEATRSQRKRLSAHFSESSTSLADAAYTLQTGREGYGWRDFVVARDEAEAREALEKEAAKPVDAHRVGAGKEVVFMFPGQGSQYVGMGEEIYRSEAVFREWVDRCAGILEGHLGLDIRTVVFAKDADERLNQTVLAQPAIFTIEYALAKLWMHWGIRPTAMAGHSVGEFTAACLAEVISLEDCLMLVAARGRMMQDLPGGAMLSVRLPEAQVRANLFEGVSIAASNSPSLTVVAGPYEAIARFEKSMNEEKVACRRLHTSHAFHSSMLDPIIEPFTALVASVALRPPVIPYLSCTTGEWIEAGEATSPSYWARHFREPVLFSAAVEKLRQKAGWVLLEVGPGITLQTLARQHPLPAGTEQLVLSSLPEASSSGSSAYILQTALGRLWSEGIEVKWGEYFGGETRGRVPLPSYPFERKSYWAANQANPAIAAVEKEIPMESQNIDQHRSRILGELSRILQDLSGLKASEVDTRISFLELGFDSLFLTQLTQAVSNEFKVKITFRQMMDELSSLQLLADYLAPQVAVAAPPPVSRASSVPSAPPTPMVPGAGIEQVIQAQMDAMSRLFQQQLEALRGVPVAVPTPLVATQIPPKAATQPSEAEFKPFGPYKPIQKGPVDGLSARQQSALDQLIESYTRKTKISKELTQKYRKVLADPRVAAGFKAQWKEMVYPLTTKKSLGSKLWDVDGNEYIDMLNGFGPIAFGHLPDFVAKAVQAQLQEGIEIGPQTELAGEVATLLCEITGNDRVSFCNTGSEAVMAALRVARTVTGRKKVVIFAGSYHGNFDEVLVKRIGKAEELRSGPIAPGVPAENLQNMIVLDYGSAESLEIIRKNAGQLAAVVVEPVQSRHPALQPKEFLHNLRKIADEAGFALVIDEVVTGFRSHPGGIQALFDIRADLVTYGKVLGGGMPIGAIAGKAAFMDALDGGMWQYGDDSYPEVGVTFFAGTFVRHPLALAAAKAVLLHLKAEGASMQQTLTRRCNDLVVRLNVLFQRYGYASLIETFGSVFYFAAPKENRFGNLLYYYLRGAGVHIQEGFPCFLTTAHTEEDVEKVCQAFEKSLQAMKAAGFLGEVDDHPAIREAAITESQLEVWLSAKLSQEASCSFNEAFTVRLLGNLNAEVFRACIEEVIGRHDALRASFDEEGTTVRFAESLDLDIPITDLTSTGEGEAELAKRIDADARQPFDLSAGPLVRCQLFKVGAEEHVLLFTSHHIVCDGWSTNVILEELGAIYSARTRGEAPNLTPALQFSEFAVSSRRDESSGKAQADERFWLNQYLDLPPVLDLPVDRARPAVKEFAGTTARRKIDAELYRGLKKAGAKQGATLFSTLLASLQVLLSKLSGQQDVVIGVPSAAQSLIEGRNLVGHCVNFLPIRAKLSENDSLGELISKAKKTMLDAYEHQEYTYGTLVRRLAIRRDPSRLPLLEVQFNLERVGAGISFAGLEFKMDPCAKAFVNFDLFLNAIESPDGLIIDCDYNSGLYDAATVERWLGHYETLLRAVVEHNDETVSRTSLLSAAEREELLFGRNKTAVDYPADACIHDLIAEQCARTPSAQAIKYRDTSLSYAELNDRANQLAKSLKQHGAGPGQLVAILLERSVQLPVAMLAVLKSGAAYVPLDPSYPKERIDFIIGETNSRIILTQEDLAIGMDAPQAQIICLDREWALIGKASADAVAGGAGAADLAYVIFTSGSTGKPKGVEIPHRAVTNFLTSMRIAPGLTATDRLLAVTTVSFDIAVLEIFLPLMCGAQVVIASPESLTDGAKMSEEIGREGITVLQATPATWRLLIEAGWKAPTGFKMLCGGEAFPRELANRLLDGGGEVWNMYGPTETTVWSSVKKIEAGAEPIVIGQPIANTVFYVLAPDGEPVAPGVPGELYIGGDGVARGYFLRPDLTNEKFLKDPFLGGDARVFRTGDLVRSLPMGCLEFLGRTDHQVKIRGFRIELGEIEAVLSSHENVREAVVVAHEEGGSKRLVAYLTTKDGSEVNATAMKAYVAGFLPPYMVPAFLLHLESMPRTPNGKIDRKALPAPMLAAQKADKPLRLASGEMQTKLAAVFSEVLKVNELSIDDNLFDLGGDSIQVFQIVARAAKVGVGISAQQVLRYPTVEDLCRNIAESGPVKAKPQLSPITAASREKYRISRG
jgi:amino acid adenylation domain-containing protein